MSAHLSLKIKFLYYIVGHQISSIQPLDINTFSFRPCTQTIKTMDINRCLIYKRRKQLLN